ncbi:MAG: segregation/condensation protein A [bacterium]|nr:segregation/condensation protein A [bacterium]
MYRVQLNNFEGPLDLLLFFIKRDELDIYDIPISYITEQFLEFIQLMEELDLDVASEFVLMASMLMSIKAKMMLPREEGEDAEEIDETDPRYELVQRLLEYKRYKEMAEKMADIDEETRKKYTRGFYDADQVDKRATGEALKDVTMFDLIGAFRKVLSDIERKNIVHKVEKVKATIEQQSEFVLLTLQNRGRQNFRELCQNIHSRVIVVVTFLAVLEMIKEQQINLYLGEDPTDFYLDLKPVDEIISANIS